MDRRARGRRARLAALLVVCAYPAICAQKPEQAIRQVLDDQTAAWNRGDLPAFVESYLDSPETLFIGREIARGRGPLLNRYRKKYANREQMGTLTFSDLEIHVLSSEYANVVGRFHLERSTAGGGNAEGVFTLLFRKTPGGWKILQDHTS